MFVYLHISFWQDTVHPKGDIGSFVCLSVCYSHNSKSIKTNRMKFGGLIGYYTGTIWLDFGIDRVKGQGEGHEKVKIVFLP